MKTREVLLRQGASIVSQKSCLNCSTWFKRFMVGATHDGGTFERCALKTIRHVIIETRCQFFVFSWNPMRIAYFWLLFQSSFDLLVLEKDFWVFLVERTDVLKAPVYQTDRKTHFYSMKNRGMAAGKGGESRKRGDRTLQVVITHPIRADQSFKIQSFWKIHTKKVKHRTKNKSMLTYITKVVLFLN